MRPISPDRFPPRCSPPLEPWPGHVVTDHRGQHRVAVGRVREQTRVGLRVERVPPLGHAENISSRRAPPLAARPRPARVATDEHQARWYRGAALEQREGDHRPERVAHEVRPLDTKRGDEGGESIGELRCAPGAVDVGRLPEAERVPGDDGVAARQVGSIHCQVRSAGAPWSMTSRAGARVGAAIRRPPTSTCPMRESCRRADASAGGARA
jgi:hypothetical protein